MKLCLIIARGRDTCEDARNMAEEMGFLCTTAENRDFAYVACQALMPDVIVIDADTTRPDGADFVDKIKKLRRGKKTLILDLQEFADRFAHRDPASPWKLN